MVLDPDPAEERDEEDALAMATRLPWVDIADYASPRRINHRHFANSDCGEAFKQLVALRTRLPDASFLALHGELGDVAAVLERALRGWDAMVNRFGLPPTSEDFRVVSARLVDAARRREAARHAQDAAELARAGDRAAAAASLDQAVVTLREIDADDDPLAQHSPELIERERAAHSVGKGFSAPRLFADHLRHGEFRGDLIALIGPAKGGKTRLMLQVTLGSVVMDALTQAPSEHQVVIFSMEMERAEFFDILEELDVEAHLLLTPSGAPRFLVYGLKWFDEVGDSAEDRRAAIDRELGRLLTANAKRAAAMKLPAARTHFAFVVYDYVTALFPPEHQNDYRVAQGVINDARRRLCRLSPAFYGVPRTYAMDLVDLPTNVLLVEQLNLRQSDVVRSKGEETQLRPVSMAQSVGTRSLFERATVLITFNRDSEGVYVSPDDVWLSLSGRYVVAFKTRLKFVNGRFLLPSDEPHAPSRAHRRVRPEDLTYVPRPPREAAAGGGRILVRPFVPTRGRWRR